MILNIKSLNIIYFPCNQKKDGVKTVKMLEVPLINIENIISYFIYFCLHSMPQMHSISGFGQ